MSIKIVDILGPCGKHTLVNQVVDAKMDHTIKSHNTDPLNLNWTQKTDAGYPQPAPRPPIMPERPNLRDEAHGLKIKTQNIQKARSPDASGK